MIGFPYSQFQIPNLDEQGAIGLASLLYQYLDADPAHEKKFYSANKELHVKNTLSIDWFLKGIIIKNKHYFHKAGLY